MTQVRVMTTGLWVYLTVSSVTFVSAILYTLFTPGEFVTSLCYGKWRALAVLNFVCCCVGLSGLFLYRKIFETLRAVEQQNLRDLFWNLAFYKFIFMFGVMNMQEISEMIGWCVWFSIIGMSMLISQLCKDRFEYLSFTPNTAVYNYAKIIVSQCLVVLVCSGLCMVCAIVGWQYGINYFLFLIAEILVVMIRAIHTLTCCVIHLWDVNHEGMWENHSLYSHYTDFLLEMVALSVDLMHHLHMILWNNFVPSLAGVVLLLQMKFIYSQIQLKLRKHYDYVAVTETLETRFPAATKEELDSYPQHCAICRDRMVSCRKLPCGHLFHLGCLRSWLYQDNSCPLCRMSIPVTPTPMQSSHDLATGSGGLSDVNIATTRHRAHFQLRNRRNPPGNQVFHFHGPTLASWLPSVSVELPGNQATTGWDRHGVQELYESALQLHNMFPHVPLHAVLIDLTRTYSIEVTIQNIITNNITVQFPFQQQQQQYQQQSRTFTTTTTPPPTETQQTVNTCSSASNSSSSTGSDDKPSHDDGDHQQNDECLPSSSSSSSSNHNSLPNFSSNNLEDNIRSAKTAGPSLAQIPRSSSFQERKAAYIEQAKRKFLLKHGSSSSI
ncbi:E3 ubiquitin-protein ligase AMFR-like [Dysidea avara]|uniref:E3 ubiquitin-protein ligase AMFR-like n=1 Tax=Dysidea avara TaxID=196820 RepID=UPI00332DFB2B